MAKKIPKLKIAQSLKDKALGLIPNPYQRMLFYTRFGIHTCFMKRPIDVLVISDTGYVMSLKTSLKPWRFYLWNPRYSKVIELPNGEIKKFKIKLGDEIIIK